MSGYLIGRLLGLPSYRDKTQAFVLTAQETLYKSILVLLTVTAILWMSIFLYATFYYTYMPAISHIRPVHLQFSSCGREKGLCTFPSANVTLTKRQKLLMVGQPYKIAVELEMPESLANQDLGMFMVCAELKNAIGGVIEKSCRSAILHYKSFFHHVIATFIFSPFLLSGSAEEKQLVPIELFSGFQEDPDHPATEAFIQIQTQHVEIYQTYLKIHAHFTGLRYFMFHWPVLAAVLGISTNFFFLAIIAFLSWYKFYTSQQMALRVGYDVNVARSLEERRALAKERLMRERGQLVSHEKIEEEDTTEALKTKKEMFDKTDEKSRMEEDPEEQKAKKKARAKELGILESSDSEKSKSSASDGRNSDEFEIISKNSGGSKDSDKEADVGEKEDDDKENDPTKIVVQSESVEDTSTTCTTNVRLRKATSSKSEA